MALLQLPFEPTALAGYANFTWLPRGRLMHSRAFELLDCHFSSFWNDFRKELIRAHRRFGIGRAVAGCEGACSYTAHRLKLLAHGLTNGWRSVAASIEDPKLQHRDLMVSLGLQAGFFQDVLDGRKALEDTPLKELNFCAYGLLFVSHFWPDALPLAMDSGMVVNLIFGTQYSGDFLSSSTWPLDFWDLLLPPKQTARELVGGGAPNRSSLVSPPLLRRSVDPQGLAEHSRLEALRGLRVVMHMGHVSFTAEIASVLLRSGASVVSVLCHEAVDAEARRAARSSEQHMESCAKTCSLLPDFCDDVRVRFEPYSEEQRLASLADLVVCMEYPVCVRMGQRYGKPLLLYDGMQYSAFNEDALLELVEHDVHREVHSGPSRPSRLLPEGLRTLVATNDPWNAESIYHRTRLRVPSVRVVSFYLSCYYRGHRSSQVYLMPNRGRCGACQVYFNFLLGVAVPERYPLELVYSNDYLDYDVITSKFRAMVAIPHGNVMQMLVFELSNMAMPILLPDLRLMSRQPFLWWSNRVAGPEVAPRLRQRYSRPWYNAQVYDAMWLPEYQDWESPHPVPFMVSTMEPGPDYVKAMLYWMRLLDYFHWDWALHFDSVPHLLELLVEEATLSASSVRQRLWLRRERRRSVRWWSSGLARLLTSA